MLFSNKEDLKGNILIKLDKYKKHNAKKPDTKNIECFYLFEILNKENIKVTKGSGCQWSFWKELITTMKH
jgi:hypothetical protein